MASHPQSDGAPPPLRRCPPPRVLLLRHPHHFSLLDRPLPDRPLPDSFHFLKPWESPLPFDDFLSSSADARSAEAILTSGRAPVTADMLRRLPEVRLVVNTSAGLNHIDLAECRRRGVAVAGAGETKSEEVADLAVGLLIDVLRKVSASDRYVRRGLWSSEGEFALGSKPWCKVSYSKAIGIMNVVSSLGNVYAAGYDREARLDSRFRWYQSQLRPAEQLAVPEAVISTCFGLNACALMASVVHHYKLCLTRLTHHMWPLDYRLYSSLRWFRPVLFVDPFHNRRKPTDRAAVCPVPRRSRGRKEMMSDDAG